MKILLISSLLLSAGICAGQNQTIFEYSKKQGKFTRAKSFIKEGSQVAIKYHEINPFAFSSNVQFTDINHDYKDGLAEAQEGIAALASSQKATEETKSEITDPSNGRSLKGLSGRGLSKSDATSLLDKTSTILNNLKGQLQKINTFIINVTGIQSVDTLMKIARKNEWIYDQDAMKKAIISPLLGFGVSKADDIAVNIKNNIQNILDYIVSANKELASLKAIAGSLADSEPEKTRLKELIKLVEAILSDIQQTYSGPNYRTIITNAGVLQANAQTMIDAPFELMPRKVGTAAGDYIKIEDELKNLDGVTKLKIENFKIKTTGGSRIDFSVGVSADIGGNGSEYTLRKNPNNVATGPDTALVIAQEIKQDSRIKLNPIIGIHWYRTTSRSLQWMLTFGLAPNFSELSNTRIYLGSSLGFPSTNDFTRRLVVSVGASLGYANVLKPKYKYWNDYARFGDIDDADLTTKALRPGLFVALTYNLGGINH